MAKKLYTTIPEQIVEQLRIEILSGQLVEGESLKAQELSERFGVSRGSIRTALMQLTQEGFLISNPNKGVKVAGESSNEIRPLLMALRRRIETFALMRIFNNITKEDLNNWKEILERLKKACEQGDVEAAIEHDMEFHRSIILKQGGRDILAVWIPIVVRKRMRYSRYRNLIDSYKEHRKIYEAILARDKNKAIKSLKANIK